MALILYLLGAIVLTLAFVIVPKTWIVSTTFVVVLNVSNIVFFIAAFMHVRKTKILVRRLRNELTPKEDPNQSKIGTRFNEKAKTLTPRFSLDYTSPTILFGLPVVDVQVGTLRIDPETLEWKHEKLRWAKGWIAIGDVATGAIAIGGSHSASFRLALCRPDSLPSACFHWA